MTSINEALDNEALTGTTITVAGWVRTFRNDRFIAINDGSTIRNLQCVIDQQEVDAATRARFNTSASVRCTGELIASQGSGQRVEMKVTSVEVLGDSPADKYPIQPKKHSLEFLRENAHLRFRTNTYSAIFRIRHQVSFGIHEYFDANGYNYFHSPIITASDAEGAGEMFQVTTLPIEKAPYVADEAGVNFSLFYSIRAHYAVRMGVLINEILEQNGFEHEAAQEVSGSITQHLQLTPDKLEILSNRLENPQLVEEQDLSLLAFQKEVVTEAFRIFHATDLGGLDFGRVQDEVDALCRSNGYTLRRRVGSYFEKTHLFKAAPEFAIAFHNLFEILPGEIDYRKDFFGRKAHLTVSGQLQAELAATALGKVYTFGPTFRAENSNTTRHLAEFWMIEPECAFMDLHGDMDLAEGLCKHLIARVLKKSVDDLQFLDARLKEEEAQKPQAQRSDMGLIDRLKFVLENPFERITYTEAIDILLRSKPHQKKRFQFPVEWGIDLQSEHERYLVEKHFKKPVIVTGYPAQIKAFYMRTNSPGDFGFSDKGKTVAAMDVLFPGIGEIIGGSQREERLDVLEARMEEMGVPTKEMWWYLDTRRFGTVPHAGFGLGLERFVLFVTGMGNIRDVIPFPRTPGSAEF